jgi:hypothetical protein
MDQMQRQLEAGIGVEKLAGMIAQMGEAEELCARVAEAADAGRR